MEKQEVIKMFKDCCNNPENNGQRKKAVELQLQRNIWELDDNVNGKIRITNYDKCNIIAFHTIAFNKDITPSMFEISKDEYNELESLYFGNYKHNEEQFNEYINHIIKNQ